MSEEKPHTFTLNGKNFRGRYLDPDKSLDALQLLAPALSEVLGNLPSKEDAGNEIAVFSKITQGVLGKFKALPEAAPFFLPVYEVEVQHSTDGPPVWLPLATQKEQIFKGKALLYVAFLVAAITKEYGSFLREGGLNMLRELGAACGFQMT